MKLYTFGDSWTKNGEFWNKQKYFKYTKPNDRPWTNQLATYLDLQLVNISRGGLGPQAIINNLIENSKLIDSNSYVVISLSPMTRFSIPTYINNNNLYNLEINVNKTEKWFERNNNKVDFKTQGITEEVKTSAINYSINVLLPLYNNYFTYYFNQTKKLLELLEEFKNIKFLFWNWEYAVHTKSNEFYINRITDHTKGKIVNSHPSVQGHNQLFSYFKNAIDNNTKYLWF